MQYKDFTPMNLFKMTIEFGKNIADEWIASKKLEEVADLVTDSKAPHMIVYRVPIAWTRVTSGHEDKQEMSTERVLIDKSISRFESMRSDPVASNSKYVDINVEAKSAEVQAKELKAIEEAKFKEFEADKQDTLMELNSATMQLK